jgi:glycosyltransferase involved in cell wall biosynthesis
MPPSLEDVLRVEADGDWLELPGRIDHDQVQELLADARAGLVVLHPEPNYVDAQPTKLFEYMAASLPIVASDFPRWRAIVGESGCGYVVDPCDVGAIADAIDCILREPVEEEAMGARGRAHVELSFSWATELSKLLMLYELVWSKSK